MARHRKEKPLETHRDFGYNRQTEASDSWGVHLRIQLISLFLLCPFASLLLATPGDQRTISELDLYDKLHGMWIGQLIGNATGRPTEGTYDGAQPNPSTSVPWQIKQTWDADDDTDIEYLALHILETYGFDCNEAEIADEWLSHLTVNGIYIANKQAWSLMLDGYLPPETGSRTYNQHWYSIDAQIGTEVFGALSPGLPHVAMDLAGRFAQVTNSGFAVHAAQFYAAMYAEAFFEPDVPTLIANALVALPPASRTTTVICDVLEWYYDDSIDGLLDWRSTRAKLYENYQGPAAKGRYYNWVESTINTGATVLALLYGQGDFKQTVQIAVLAGWDCDCNPATAGGLLGIISGFSDLPADLTDPAVCGNTYLNVSRPGLPDPHAPLPQSEPITQIASRTLDLAAENLFLNSASYRQGRFSHYYGLSNPDTAGIDVVSRPIISPPLSVPAPEPPNVIVTPSASVTYPDQAQDRRCLSAISDDIADNSHTGQRPYSTYLSDPAAKPALDWYELSYSSPIRFDRLTFYEGDVVWSRINAYYRDDRPRGGYFQDLTVQVRRNGQYFDPLDLRMSPALDPFMMHQIITFDFTPIVGDAIRITGTPGGTDRFTTILELDVPAQPYLGPQLSAVTLVDAETSPTHTATLALNFTEAVTLNLSSISLHACPAGAPIDLPDAALSDACTGIQISLALPPSLSPGQYELQLDCRAVYDEFGFPLIDDDADPDDSARTYKFTTLPSLP